MQLDTCPHVSLIVEVHADVDSATIQLPCARSAVMILSTVPGQDGMHA